MAGDIPEYNAGNLDIRPSEIGVESTSAAGRRLGVYGSQIAASKEQTGREVAGAVKSVGDQALQVAEHFEIAKGASHGAALMASATQGLNAYMSGADIPDGPDKQSQLDERLNNPKAAQQWIDSKLNPSLEQFQSGFITEGGQQYAQRFTANLRDHMVTAAMADQSTAAGIALKGNLQKTADGYATAAFNSHNLHDVTGYINAFDHAVGAISSTSPTINADGQARIKEWAEQEKAKIITTAVQGRILAGGSYADITAAYPQYIQPGQNAMFQRQEAFYQKSAAVAAKQELLLNKQIAEQRTQSTINDSFSKYVHVDEQTGHVTIDPKFAVDMQHLPFNNPGDPQAATHAKTWLDWTEAQQKPPPVRDNPMATGLLLSAISNPKASLDDAKTAIAKAEISKDLTPQTAAQMRQLATDLRNINDPLLTKSMESAKAIVQPKFGAEPDAFAKFYYDFIHNQYQPAKIAGTLPPNALDMNDPKSMISMAIDKAKPSQAATTKANGGIGGPPLSTYTAPKPGPDFKPPPNWQTNGRQYRDPQGNLYDLQGNRING
jgi:hypothetical protein